MTEPLRLIALDAEDLAILSAKFQDAQVKIGDMAYLPKTKRFALVAARFDWAALEGGKTERCSSGLHFERVLKVARLGFDQTAAEETLNLLSIMFVPAEPPTGRVLLTFSGAAAVQLDVECLEAQMRDLGTRWPVDSLPGHLMDDIEMPPEPSYRSKDPRDGG
jgi:hypothetical protein